MFIRLFCLTLSLLWLTACTEVPPFAPDCRSDLTQALPASPRVACIVVEGHLMLSLQGQDNPHFTLPGGTRQADERAQCAAHRNLWEQTGFNARITRYLGQDPQGTAYFLCPLENGLGPADMPMPAPPWNTGDDIRLTYIDPFAITHKDWADPEGLLWVRQHFVKAGKP